MGDITPINIIVECPHCKVQILIEQLNCCIFRHAIFKNNGKQIDPHTNKNLCDIYIQQNLIYGCGKPFKIIENISVTTKCDKFIAIACDYI